MRHGMDETERWKITTANFCIYYRYAAQKA